jgi:hypothetical protein
VSLQTTNGLPLVTQAKRGGVGFRQMTETTEKCTLNFVTINTSESATDFSTVVSDLNAIYSTMNISWHEGVPLKIIVNEYEEDLQNKKVDIIMETLRSHPQYKSNQYYMVVSPLLSVGFANYTLKDNYIFTPDIYDKKMPAHEIGHCSGLDEFVVNIGLFPKEERYKASDSNIQKYTTNVMGYSSNNIDFYSWQIPTIRQHIIERINSK